VNACAHCWHSVAGHFSLWKCCRCGTHAEDVYSPEMKEYELKILDPAEVFAKKSKRGPKGKKGDG
jgi:hypothetical protein